MKIDGTKAMEWYELRSHGLSFNQIAKDTGYSRQQIQREVRNLEKKRGPALEIKDMTPALASSQQTHKKRRRWKITELNRLIEAVNETCPPGTKYIRWKEVQEVGGFQNSRDVRALRKKWEYHSKFGEIKEQDGRYVISNHETPQVPEPIQVDPVEPKAEPRSAKTTKSFFWGLYTVIREE